MTAAVWVTGDMGSINAHLALTTVVYALNDYTRSRLERFIQLLLPLKLHPA
jgi:hypothetical protein